MQPLRILKVSDVFAPRVNGVSTAIQTMSEALRSLGHEVTVVAPNYPGAASAEHVLRLPSLRVPFDAEDRLMLAWNLAPRLAGREFDIVHVHTPFVAHGLGLGFARRLGVPCVTTYHTYFEAYLHHYLPLLPRRATAFFARRLARQQCNACAAVIAPSSAMRDQLIAYGVERPINVLPTGVPPAWFAAGDGAAFRRRLGIDPRRPVLVYVGRIAHEKNIGFLLEVTAEVRRRFPDVLLLLAGEGPAEAALRRRVARSGLAANVQWVGYLREPQALRDCYRAGDLFVFASTTETQGLVLLEAMALGVPVVAVAMMGTRDVLRDGHGARVARLEVADFAGKVTALLADPLARERLARAAPAHAHQWSTAELTARLIGLYRTVIEQPATADRPAALSGEGSSP